VQDAKVVVLFWRALVDLYLDFWIVLWCHRVVNEAVVCWVIEDQSEWLLTFLVLLQLINEFEELIVSLTISLSEGIVFLKLLNQFTDQSLDCRVQTAH
jgi:hypothetical protein